DYSLLIGANNEGKSNILHALVIAMEALVGWHRYMRRSVDGRIIRPSHAVFARGIGGYDWLVDFPVSKQNKAKENGQTRITLEFLLDDAEIADFKKEIKSNLNGTLPILVTFGRD